GAGANSADRRAGGPGRCACRRCPSQSVHRLYVIWSRVALELRFARPWGACRRRLWVYCTDLDRRRNPFRQLRVAYLMSVSGPAAPAAGCYNRVVARGTMKDQYGRELRDLRISLTDRCNLRCVYCMPAEGIDFRPAEEVLAGIAAAEHAGLRPIKLNSVVVRGFNDDDVVPLAALTLERPWEVRFIEMMPFGSVGDFAEAGVVKSEEIQARIESGLGPLE